MTGQQVMHVISSSVVYQTLSEARDSLSVCCARGWHRLAVSDSRSLTHLSV